MMVRLLLGNALALALTAALPLPRWFHEANARTRERAGGKGELVAAAPTRAPLPEERVLGIVDYGDARTEDVVIAPTSVRAGEEFAVTLMTFGGGCDRAGDTGVVLAESAANVMVYDFTVATRPGVICPMILKRLPHKVAVQFTKPGDALIRVWGRRVTRDTPPMGVPVVIERHVLVQ